MENYLKQTDSSEIKNWLNTTVVKYLKKNPEDVGEIEHIVDYLNSPSAPKRLRRMSYAQAKANAEKWVRAQVKKGSNIEESEDDIKVVKEWASGFRLVQLVGPNAFKREGFLMSHCVGSYADKKDTKIYSLRDPGNMPHCTMEVCGDQMNQIKGKGNGSIHPDYIKYIISTLTAVFKVPVRSSEMTNLGYITPPEGYIALMKEVGLNPKTFTYKKIEYLYISK